MCAGVEGDTCSVCIGVSSVITCVHALIDRCCIYKYCESISCCGRNSVVYVVMCVRESLCVRVLIVLVPGCASALMVSPVVCLSMHDSRNSCVFKC